jgi:CHAT domain-containing protein
MAQAGTVIYLTFAGESRPEVITAPDFSLETLADLLTGPGGWIPTQRPWLESGRTADALAWSAAADGLLERLHRHLIRPILPRLHRRGVRRLFLVPHRGLHVLPLHAAYEVRGGRPVRVCDEFDVGYAPSGTLAVLAAARSEAAFPNPTLLAVRGAEHGLRQVRRELEAVARQFEPAALTLAAGEANPWQIRKEMRLRSHFHFSGHASFDPSSPLESGLELGPGGRLLAGDLFDGRVMLPRVRVACLSGCGTGLTDPDDVADEYVGLAGGFLCAGAEAVVSSLWPVNDLPTSRLMRQFYEHLRQSPDPVGALNAAQRSLRAGPHAGPLAETVFWAPFTVTTHFTGPHRG